jgi:aromatic ring hydroxylase
VGARTGQNYIDALRDGREVWWAGKRVDDVPTHPGFAGTVRTLARLYDRQHDPADRDRMTVEWEGERISYSYFPPSTPEELLAKRGNVECWSEATLGHMGRFPDFCAQLTVGMIEYADDLGKADPRFGQNALAYHRYCASRDLCLTHALNDQYYDRSKRVLEQEDPDLCLHVVRETAEGIVVRGLRSLATLAPLSDETLVYPIRPRAADEQDYALAFAVPMNAPGLITICRDLYAASADPERLPLTTQFDEVDASLVFDDVLVPWERVFVYRNPPLAAQFHRRLSLWATYATLIRLISRLEAFIGAAELLTQWDKRADNRTTQVMMGQLIQDLEVLRGCVRAAEIDAYRTPAGLLAPLLTESYRLHSIDAADRAVRLLQDILTSSVLLTGGVSDLESPAIGRYVERFFRGGAPSTREHLRVLAVVSDMVMSAFAARNQLYERLQSGEPDATRARLYGRFDRARLAQRLLDFVHEDWAPATTPAELRAP